MARRKVSFLTLCAFALAAMTATAARAADDKEELKTELKSYNSITGTQAIADKVKELIKDKARAEKLLAVAEDMIKLDSKSFNYNGGTIIARTAVAVKKYDLALRFYKHCGQLAAKVKSTNKMLEAFDGQYLLMLELKQFADAEKLLQQVLEMEGDDEFDKAKPFLMENLVQTKTRQGKIEEALKITDSLIKLDEGGWYFVRLKGSVYHQAGKYAESAKAYLDTLERLKNADRLKPEEQERWTERTRYILSSVYVDLGEIDKSAEQLQILLKKKPDNSTYNNDLGFIWADHDMNLDEAEKLIRKAIEEDRKQRKALANLPKEEDVDNAAYLDSLGWVMFKKKNYAEAKKYLLEAVKDKEDGQHIEIMDHLADVHFALGEKKEAISIWKKTLDMDPSGARDIKRKELIFKKLKAAEGK